MVRLDISFRDPDHQALSLYCNSFMFQSFVTWRYIYSKICTLGRAYGAHVTKGGAFNVLPSGPLKF